MVQDYLLFYPNNHIISSSSLIVAEIMIETYLCNPSFFEQCNYLIRPEYSYPTFWRLSFIIQIQLHMLSYN